VLFNRYYEDDQIKEGEMCRTCSVHGGNEMCTKFARPRHRWEVNIKMDLREIEFGGVDRIHLAQDRDWW
jgi:hypothetical protein